MEENQFWPSILEQTKQKNHDLCLIYLFGWPAQNIIMRYTIIRNNLFLTVLEAGKSRSSQGID